MRLLIATGGTGGHIYPAIALADAAKKRYPDIEILFVGNDDRMEAEIVPNHGYAFEGLHACGMTGNVFHKMKAVTLMGKAYLKALKIMDRFQPDIAFGFGGYVSAPVMLAAHREGVVTMIHEQNSVVGMSNKVVAKYMDAIVICYEKCYEEFGREKVRLLGNPRATSAVETKFDAQYFQSLGLKEDKPLILVVMGSLGSSSIYEMMKDVLPTIDSSYQILFVSGKDKFAEVKSAFPQENIVVVDYVRQLDIIEKVDLLICRAGATTAAEILALGSVSILIPSPYVAHNHQFYNASVMVEDGAAEMIEEKDLSPETLKAKIEAIMNHPAKRESIHQNALRLGKPNACSDILDWCEELLRNK